MRIFKSILQMCVVPPLPSRSRGATVVYDDLHITFKIARFRKQMADIASQNAIGHRPPHYFWSSYAPDHRL